MPKNVSVCDFFIGEVQLTFFWGVGENEGNVEKWCFCLWG